MNYLKMSEQKKKSNLNTELTAKLYLALDDLTMALATEDKEEVRKSEVFQKALEVVKVVKEMRRLQVKPAEGEEK
ncbi:hypothetical protein SIRV1gp28 [Sulfolobus islandicus rod-shaped virus 1]|uniref:Uncharacterized protein 74 n=1 Tax=Sulfolobus islandicus rod-shaped virus 1 TaxID=157898 RepID=Y74_SIRV1|nr:hypothetical protein SIRV1gp28 [Sulfolobus islandicus rod-shaped virus 1]Q8QL28.1 RecName: Full=Uncharacterized protein 74 [Sulfolobus islandicus rod-shaped virus 1]CAC93983.1 hypothetical protein [Sulfolobus islandicus rod-shaped virus 1]CAG38847.1 hypothetical protein [Sulfolobus islandicus rudivirus 1 variant XX]